MTESLAISAATDVGNVREHNEDNHLVDKELGLFIVADGMGGHAAGEVASALAVKTVHEEVLREKSLIADFIKGARGASRVTKGSITTLLEHAIHRACSRVHQEAQKDDAKRGMGTTMSVLLVAGEHAFIAHVGDSRIYMLRSGGLSQVTEDHTVENELIKKNRLTPEQIAKVASKKNALMRAVGVYERVEVDTLVLDVLPQDTFVLCSDGLSQYLDTANDLVSRIVADGDATTASLIAYAKQKGGSDNITVLLVRAEGNVAAAAGKAKLLALSREVLAKVPLFARLTERELLRVLQITEAKAYPTGTVLVKEGEKSDELFIVLSGEVHVTRGGASLTHLGPGQQMGEMAIIRNVPRSATVTASKDTEVLTLRRVDFFEILRDEHEMGIKMLWQFLGVLADRLDSTSRELKVAREELVAEEIDVAPDSDDFASPFSMR